MQFIVHTLTEGLFAVCKPKSLQTLSNHTTLIFTETALLIVNNYFCIFCINITN